VAEWDAGEDELAGDDGAFCENPAAAIKHIKKARWRLFIKNLDLRIPKTIANWMPDRCGWVLKLL
jgi:hypothetical protein